AGVREHPATVCAVCRIARISRVGRISGIGGIGGIRGVVREAGLEWFHTFPLCGNLSSHPAGTRTLPMRPACRLLARYPGRGQRLAKPIDMRALTPRVPV